MNRHGKIRAILLAFFAAVALQQFVDDLKAKEQSRHAFSNQLELPGRDALRFFAAPADRAPADHIAIPVLGVERNELHDDFLGSRRGHVHQAIDIMAARGTPVVAAVDGTIAKILRSEAGGNTIYLTDEPGTTVYYYAHLDRYAARLTETQRVRRGQVIGFVGTTGNAPPNAPHLHFAIDEMSMPRDLRSAMPVNPFPILTARGVTYRISGGVLTAASAR